MLGSFRDILTDCVKDTKKEVKTNPIVYFILSAILLLAFFVRVYRLDQLLGFFFDQGRDAIIIWELWYGGKPFLIGPVTGLAGIFLGPFYYYLIAPFYLVGGGDPVVPAVFLAFLVTLGILLVYYLGWKMQDRTTGLIAAFIASFSYYLVLAGRWLSNPTPIMLSSMILFWSMWELVNNGDKRWWIIAALMIGLSLQFESASAVFYLPVIFVFAIWKYWTVRKEKEKFGLFDKKILIASSGIFFLTLLPQILFNFRHDGILFNNFKSLFLEEKSFSANVSIVLSDRLNYFWDVFSSKILVGKPHWAPLFTMFSFGAVVFGWQTLYQKRILQLFAIFLLIPMLGYVLFQGNYGNIYDYYMTGYYFQMILFFSIGLGVLWRHPIGKLVVAIYFVLFLNINGVLLKNYLVAGVDGPTHISLGNEMQAVDWILDDAMAQSEEFNIDIYVPPVIPHSYEYLFTWQGTKRCHEELCGWEREEEKELVYVLYEQDPPHPERLERWLNDRQDNTEILEEERFGGITVQRRIRL